ncbi:teichoic acid D-Ala incorporation-associated protein DltX [Streptococcus suis]
MQHPVVRFICRTLFYFFILLLLLYLYRQYVKTPS